jgi:ribose transport system substrate-binding protein
MLFELQDVTKTYGAVTALDNLSVSVPAGAIGLLGPNGSGKTTMIRTLLGLIPVDKGAGEILAMDFRRRQLDIRTAVGFAPEDECLFPRVDGVGFVAYAGELVGMSRKDALQRAASAEGIELIVVDNQYNAKIAQRNADLLVREKVDLVIEFQTDEEVAPIVAAKYRAANIPLIAIEIPHPGATYYGANNYEAGLIGGRHLGRWVKRRWEAEADEILLLELHRAGNLPRMRLTGMLVGMKEIYPALENCRVTYLDGDGKLGESFEAMRRHLRSSKARGSLIGAINDPSALGALRAMQEAGRIGNCALMGQNAAPEGREELRQPGTRLIGSVAYFPEKYGADIVAVALDILNRRAVPPAVFVKHQLVTPENVDHIYPNDRLMQTAGTFA